MSYRLVVGNRNYSSWSLRGWLLLEAFGIDFSCETVRLYAEGFGNFLQQFHPAATVPALEVTGGVEKRVLWDSLAIAEYLHEQHPRVGIWPADPAARAAARCLCAEMHSSYQALRNGMPMNLRRVPKALPGNPDLQRDVDRIESLWAWAASRWGDEGPYLFGSFCAADAFYVPVASRFQTYRVVLKPASERYVKALLAHPATRKFVDASREEDWIIDAFEV